MNQKSTSRFLLDGFLYILVFPLIFRRVRGGESRALDLEEYLINHYLHDELKEFKDMYDPAVTEATKPNNNDEYPYEELLSFVKETKRILQSPHSVVDQNKKEILERNFGPRYYSAYLVGDNSDSGCPDPVRFCPPIPALGLVPPAPPVLRPQIPINFGPPPVYTSLASPGFGGYNHTYHIANKPSDAPRAPVPTVPNAVKPEKYPCQQVTQFLRPKRLKSVDGKEHYILNLGNEFVQEIKIVQCRDYQGHCGDSSKWPEAYEKVCEQTYNSYKTLFSVPVDKKIDILDQNLHVFEVASGCNCLLRRKEGYTY